MHWKKTLFQKTETKKSSFKHSKERITIIFVLIGKGKRKYFLIGSKIKILIVY